MIEIATIRDMTFVLANLRDPDREELRAQLGGFTGYDLAVQCLQAGNAFVARVNGVPAMAFGGAHQSPTTLSAWSFGTKDFRRAVPMASRFIMGPLRDHSVLHGYRWAEARVMASHDTAIRWMQKSLGAEVAGHLPGYGVGGEDFILMRRHLIDPPDDVG